MAVTSPPITTVANGSGLGLSGAKRGRPLGCSRVQRNLRLGRRCLGAQRPRRGLAPCIHQRGRHTEKLTVQVERLLSETNSSVHRHCVGKPELHVLNKVSAGKRQAPNALR